MGVRGGGHGESRQGHTQNKDPEMGKGLAATVADRGGLVAEEQRATCIRETALEDSVGRGKELGYCFHGMGSPRRGDLFPRVLFGWLSCLLQVSLCPFP